METAAAVPGHPEPGRHRVGLLEFVDGQPFVIVGGRVVQLTRRELEVLAVLAEHPGQVVLRDDLYARVWGVRLQQTDRSLDVYIRRLRRKLEAAAPGWTFIDTYHRIGHRFAPRRSDSAPPGRHP